MSGDQVNRSRLFPCMDPDRARPADQRKRVLSKDLGRPVEREDDGIVRVRADGVELIRHSQTA